MNFTDELFPPIVQHGIETEARCENMELDNHEEAPESVPEESKVYMLFFLTLRTRIKSMYAKLIEKSTI